MKLSSSGDSESVISRRVSCSAIGFSCSDAARLLVFSSIGKMNGSCNWIFYSMFRFSLAGVEFLMRLSAEATETLAFRIRLRYEVPVPFFRAILPASLSTLQVIFLFCLKICLSFSRLFSQLFRKTNKKHLIGHTLLL